MKWGKMSKNNSWLIWLVAIVAVVALIVAVITIAKVNMTGQGIFEWFKKESSQTQQQFQIAESRGILADAYLSIGGDENFLKDYEVKYDADGNLIYEIINGGKRLIIGNKYEFNLNSTSQDSGEILNPSNGDASVGYPLSSWVRCGCLFGNSGTGGCQGSCSYIRKMGNIYDCEGPCSGNLCTSEECVISTWWAVL